MPYETQFLAHRRQEDSSECEVRRSEFGLPGMGDLGPERRRCEGFSGATSLKESPVSTCDCWDFLCLFVFS